MTTLEKVKLQRDLANNMWSQGYYTARQLDTGDAQEILWQHRDNEITFRLIAEDEGLDFGEFIPDFQAGVDKYAEEMGDMQQVPYEG